MNLEQSQSRNEVLEDDAGTWQREMPFLFLPVVRKSLREREHVGARSVGNHGERVERVALCDHDRKRAQLCQRYLGSSIPNS